MLIAPLSKTPMDKKAARQLNTYADKLGHIIDDMTPWASKSKLSALRRKYGRVLQESGEDIVVIFDATDDPDNPLFKDAPTVGELKKRAREKERKANDGRNN